MFFCFCFYWTILKVHNGSKTREYRVGVPRASCWSGRDCQDVVQGDVTRDRYGTRDDGKICATTGIGLVGNPSARDDAGPSTQHQPVSGPARSAKAPAMQTPTWKTPVNSAPGSGHGEVCAQLLTSCARSLLGPQTPTVPTVRLYGGGAGKRRHAYIL